jgi:hypothetical protein
VLVANAGNISRCDIIFQKFCSKVGDSLEISAKSLKEGRNCGFHSLRRKLCIKSSLARRVSQLILKVGFDLLGFPLSTSKIEKILGS